MRIRTGHMPSVSNYGDALEAWSKGKPWRDQPDHIRDLGARRKKHMSVRKHENGDVIFRLYATDVVTWHPDNTVTLRSYRSASTDAFATALMPLGAWASFPNVSLMNKAGEFRLFQVGKDGTITLRDTGETYKSHPDNTYTYNVLEPITETTPYRVARLDKKKAHAALKKYNYHDFAAWLKASYAMGRQFTGYGLTSYWSVVTALESGPERWPEIVSGMMTRSAVLEFVRNAIYREENCAVVETVPSVDTYKYYNIEKTNRRYGIRITY